MEWPCWNRVEARVMVTWGRGVSLGVLVKTWIGWPDWARWRERSVSSWAVEAWLGWKCWEIRVRGGIVT